MLEESHIYFRKAADVLGLPNKLRDILKNSTSRSCVAVPCHRVGRRSAARMGNPDGNRHRLCRRLRAKGDRQ
jgi:hypothetical protein